MKKLCIILLSGVVWGLFEATGGWFLHLLQLKHLTPFLIVVGIVTMTFATVKTKILTAPIMVALIATLIKLSNIFFLDGRPLFWIFNPAVYILIEGLLCSIITISFGIIFYRKNSKWILFPGMEENEQYEI